MPKPTATQLAEQETRLALVEQRTTSIENFQLRFENKLDRLIDKLDHQVITKKEYEADMKTIKACNKEVDERLKEIELTMVTKDEMKSYRQSQFWQKIFSAVATSVITALIVYELTKK